MSLFTTIRRAAPEAVAAVTTVLKENGYEAKIRDLEQTLTLRTTEFEQHIAIERRKIIALEHAVQESKRICDYVSRLVLVDDIPQLEKQSPWPFDFFKFPQQAGVYYFNSSIIRFEKQLWICCRRLRQEVNRELNDLVMFQLNDQLHPDIMVPVILPLERPEDNYEDPRLFIHRKELWVGSCNFRVGSYAHQCVSRLDRTFQCVEHIRPAFGNNRGTLGGQIGHEKNWIWFSHDKELHFIYKTSPKHCIVRTENGKPVEEFVTHKTNPLWKAGEPRGGTTPVKVGDEYWTFFHSSTPWRDRKRRYHMGATAFRAEPPFEMTRMTTMPLLTGSENDVYRHGLPPVVFPNGAIFENDVWTVSMGVNDTSTAWVKIPMDDLEQMMRKI